jgi:hypothetical protein
VALELDGRYNNTKILDYSSKIIANAEKLQTLELYSKIRRLRQESQRKSKIIIHDGLLSYDEAYILERIYFCRNHAESRVFKQCNFYH